MVSCLHDEDDMCLLICVFVYSSENLSVVYSIKQLEYQIFYVYIYIQLLKWNTNSYIIIIFIIIARSPSLSLRSRISSRRPEGRMPRASRSRSPAESPSSRSDAPRYFTYTFAIYLLYFSCYMWDSVLRVCVYVVIRLHVWCE